MAYILSIGGKKIEGVFCNLKKTKKYQQISVSIGKKNRTPVCIASIQKFNKLFRLIPPISLAVSRPTRGLVCRAYQLIHLTTNNIPIKTQAAMKKFYIYIIGNNNILMIVIVIIIIIPSKLL